MQYVSVSISILAFAVSVISLIENRRNNRIGHSAEIRGHESENPTGYSYAIQNKGKGAAYFKKVDYFLDRKLLKDNSLREALANVLTQAGVRYELSITQPGQESILQAGEVMQLVKISVPLEDAARLKAIPSERFGVRILYKSVHGKNRVWVTDDRLPKG